MKDLGTRLTNLFMNNSDFKGKPAFFVVPMNFVLSESGISTNQQMRNKLSSF